MKLLTKLKLVIFYLNGEYDEVYASIDDHDCHYLKAFYARSHSGLRLESYLELVVKKPREIKMCDFTHDLALAIEQYGFSSARVDKIVTASTAKDKHMIFMSRLFPDHIFSEDQYEVRNRGVNAPHLRYVEFE